MAIRVGGGRTRLISLSLLWLAGLFLFAEPLARLVRDWARNDDYSHGFLIIPAAAWMVWRDRAALRALPRQPNAVGLIVVLIGLLVLFTGTLGAELFLTRVSLLIVLAGAVLFLRGVPTLKRLAFPLAILILMIPLPSLIFNQLAFPLQLLASKLGVSLLRLGAIPVLREGNVIVLANMSLEVAEACSGIRSLVSLLTLAILYGYVSGHGPLRRAVLAVSAIPIAIAANALRVAGAGVTAHLLGAESVEGFLHFMSGWIVFVASLLMLLAIDGLISRIAKRPPASYRGVQVAS